MSPRPRARVLRSPAAATPQPSKDQPVGSPPSGARTACGCDKDWPRTTSMPPLTAGCERRGFRRPIGPAGRIGWHGRRSTGSAAASFRSTGLFQQRNRKLRGGRQPIDAACDIAGLGRGNEMTSLTRMLPIAPHAVSAMSNTLTLVFAGRSGDTSTASRRMIVPPRSKTTRSSAKPRIPQIPGW